jgi:SAM-dependent methyltransferase
MSDHRENGKSGKPEPQSQPPAYVHRPPPLRNLLRLSFDSAEQARAYWGPDADMRNMRNEIWLWHENFGNREEAFCVSGLCDICEHQTTYTVKPHRLPDGDKFRVWWQHDARCGCNMSALERAVMRVFLDECSKEDRVYHVGHHSAFRWWLSERIPNVTASQYEPGRRPGEIENGIQYEDLTHLSFADSQFDCVICMEVLEHVPDYRLALRELARTLRPGGRALLTFPFLGGEIYDHLVRAELLPDGTINHILPPEYHGDPANNQGILSFRSFGWKILDELRDAGFACASNEYIFGPLHGHFALIGVVVAIR